MINIFKVVKALNFKLLRNIFCLLLCFTTTVELKHLEKKVLNKKTG